MNSVLRMTVCLLLSLLVCSSTCFSQTKSPSNGQRPNILFVISDDQSWAHTGANGDKIVKTPVFDRIAREGVLFPNSFCSSPSCSPSRAAILTGQAFFRLGDAANLWGSLHTNYPLYTDMLETAGYKIGMTGKGWGPASLKLSGRTRNPAGPVYDNFGDFLKSVPKDKPFCFWYGSRDPHRTYDTGSGLKSGMKIEDVSVPAFLPDIELVRSDILDYYLEINRFDKQLGELIKMLETTGQLDNTIVVVTSDNGFPYPRGKCNLYDLGVRMPFAVRWPAKIPGGRVVTDFISHTDLAPTFLEAAGLKPRREMTGKSLLSTLKSGKAGRVEATRDMVIVGRERHGTGRKQIYGKAVGYPMRAVRTDDYLYIRNFKPERLAGGTWDGNADMDASELRAYIAKHKDDKEVRQAYILGFDRRPAEELYEVKNDPWQINNLADQLRYAGVKNRMRKAMERLMTRLKDPRSTPDGDVFDNYPSRANEYNSEKESNPRSGL